MGDDCPDTCPTTSTSARRPQRISPIPCQFDLVVGQYVLLHHPDPAAFIGGAAARLQLRGIIAFREIDMRKAFETLPPVPRLDDE
jgi:2-polyprenyl-3-methyl-5-hydroxy-6-metoxy-1,4-benzoquinol methylase